MTENERAINTLDAMKKQFFGETRDVLDMAIQALEEIQQYRAIGTIEEFKALKETDEDLRLKYCYEDLSEADNWGYMRGYNKAIDEFAERMKDIEQIAIKCTRSQSDGYSQIMRICDEMKGVRSNDL